MFELIKFCLLLFLNPPSIPNPIEDDNGDESDPAIFIRRIRSEQHFDNADIIIDNEFDWLDEIIHEHFNAVDFDHINDVINGVVGDDDNSELNNIDNEIDSEYFNAMYNIEWDRFNRSPPPITNNEIVENNEDPIDENQN